MPERRGTPPPPSARILHLPPLPGGIRESAAMSESYRALSSDFYVNLKLNLKLDLPRERQTILDLFDRVRRQFPSMNQFRRYRDELALEAEPAAAQQPIEADRDRRRTHA